MSEVKEKAPPWQEFSEIWKTKAAFMSWLRSGIRKSLWNNSPIKLEFIKKSRIMIPNPNPKGHKKEVWGGKCALTGELLPLKSLQCDHKIGNNSLQDISDIQSFVESIALVSHSDLQLVSIEAHKAKSLAERQGISFEEAVVTKKAIEIEKKGMKEVVAFLSDKGYTPTSNKDKRRLQLIEYFTKENKDI